MLWCFIKTFSHTHWTQKFGLFFFFQGKCCVWVGGGVQYRRQRGSSVPDSWLNFRWTLSSWRVRTNSCGTMAAELSLSRLSFRLLRKTQWRQEKGGRKMQGRKCEMVQSAIRGWLPVRKQPAWRKRHPLALCLYMGSRDFTTPLSDRYLILRKTQWLRGKSSNGVVTKHHVVLVAKKQWW